MGPQCSWGPGQPHNVFMRYIKAALYRGSLFTKPYVSISPCCWVGNLQQCDRLNNLQKLQVSNILFMSPRWYLVFCWCLSHWQSYHSFLLFFNGTGGVMVSVLVSRAVDRGFESPVSTQHWGERANTGWVGIRIMCLSVTTCLSSIVISVS